MAINWPIPTTVGEIYSYFDPISGKTYSWIWNGEAWKSLGEYTPGPTGATGATGAGGGIGGKLFNYYNFI